MFLNSIWTFLPMFLYGLFFKKEIEFDDFTIV